MKQYDGYPKRQVNGLAVALVGAHVAGFLHVATSKVYTGSVGLSTPTHWVILGVSVGLTLFAGRRLLRFLDQEPEINFEEERA